MERFELVLLGSGWWQWPASHAGGAAGWPAEPGCPGLLSHSPILGSNVQIGQSGDLASSQRLLASVYRWALHVFCGSWLSRTALTEQSRNASACLHCTVDRKPAQQPVQPSPAPWPEVWSVKHKGQGNVPAHSEAEGKYDPFPDRSHQRMPAGRERNETPSGLRAASDYTEALADSISVAVIRLER